MLLLNPSSKRYISVDNNEFSNVSIVLPVQRKRGKQCYCNSNDCAIEISFPIQRKMGKGRYYDNST